MLSVIHSNRAYHHPCVCREKRNKFQFAKLELGSPLRVQGKANIYSISSSDQRITPACAGKSMLVSKYRRHFEDHPCVCREKPLTYVSLVALLGSPLRVQGKAFSCSQRRSCSRITPACAGKSVEVGAS